MSIRQAEPPAGFAVFPLDTSVQRGIAAAGCAEPRPVQLQTIPAALEGRDVLGLTQTGTGRSRRGQRRRARA